MSAGDVDGLVTALTAEADTAVHYSLLRRLVAYLADPSRELQAFLLCLRRFIHVFWVRH